MITGNHRVAIRALPTQRHLTGPAGLGGGRPLVGS